MGVGGGGGATARPGGPAGGTGPSGAPRRFPHLPALDGLRGVAVALVVAYHLAPSAVPGGFLGVDIFFVLSGFLITSLLVDEVAGTGGVDLRSFYVRRVRRLTPALLLLLAALCVYAEVWASTAELSRLRSHALWTLGYLANWSLIADGTAYTDVVVGQSPLRHAWSLAIEEQFYVVFPLVVLAVGRSVRWRPHHLRRGLLVVATVGAAVSAAWMAVRWGDGADPSRGYFGTDTRAHSLLVGVGLGAVLVGRPPQEGRFARVATAGGLAAVGGLAAAVLVAREDAAWLQRGGFLAVALAAAAAIAGSASGGPLPWLLERRPLVALGRISYGVYLWHWPVVVLVDQPRTGLDGTPLLLLRLGLTLGAAIASYVLVERPVRQGALGRRLGPAAALAAPAAAAALVVAVVAATTLPPRPSALAAAAAVPAVPLTTEVGSPPAGPALVVFGDSVAHTLAGGTVAQFPSFEPWTPDRSPVDPSLATVWSVARPACSYLPGLIVVAPGASPADLSGFCTGWREDTAAALAAHPGATLVVALANDASERRIDGERVALGSPAHDDLVHSLLDELRSLADAHGATLALVALPPRIGRAATAFDEDGQRERLMRDALRGYARSRPDVQLLDLFEQVCPQADCGRPARGFDPAWRYDGLHYTPEGARWVVTWLIGALGP